MKICKTCEIERDESEFSRHKLARDGLNATCKPCKAEKQRVYRANNLEAQREATRRWRKGATEHVREYEKAYREKNRDQRIERCRSWRERNPEKQTAAERRYVESNRGKVNAKNMRRHAAKILRTVGWADLDAIDGIYERAVALTEQTGVKHHVDHIIPMQGEKVSGLHVETNLQILTQAANCSKGNTYKVA